MDRRVIFSPAGLLAAVILFVAVNVAAGPLLRWARLDLTQGRLHTLSKGTENILNSLDKPLSLKLFWSAEGARDLPALQVYARRVSEVLQEYQALAGGRIQLTVIDPKPFSEEEDEAVGFGIQGVTAPGGGESIYFGLAATSGDGRSLVIPFFQPDRETFLEHDISQMIHTLSRTGKVKAALLSALPIAGGPSPENPFEMQPPWMISDQLYRQFDLEVILNEESIPEGIEVLMVVNPHDLDSRALYAVDQFVLRGGRALVFVDPLVDYQAGRTPTAGIATPGKADDLLAAWGLKVELGKVVGDAATAQKVSYRDQNRIQTVNYLPWLALGEEQINREEITTAQLSHINLASAGSLMQAEGAGTSFNPLLYSSPQAMLIDASKVAFLPDPARLLSEFSAAGISFVLGARVSGPAATAFPDGPPEPAASGQEDRSQEPREHLDRSTGDINVVVIADSDLLEDRFWVEVQNFFGQRIALPMADNADLVVNVLDQLGGSPDLIGIRSRARTYRPFVLLDRVSRDAEMKFRAKEQELVARLEETEGKLKDLQAQRQDPDSAQFTAEQEEELENFLQEKVRIRRDLRNVQFELRRDIRRLEAWIKFINIGLVPLLLTLGALAVWTARRDRKQRYRKGA